MLTFNTYNILLKFSGGGYNIDKKYKWRDWLCGSYWIQTRRPLQCLGIKRTNWRQWTGRSKRRWEMMPRSWISNSIWTTVGNTRWNIQTRNSKPRRSRWNRRRRVRNGQEGNARGNCPDATAICEVWQFCRCWPGDGKKRFHGRKVCQVEGHAADCGAYVQGSC